MREIARGGMGVVYQAYDDVTGRLLALKRCLPERRSALFDLLFQREYQTLAALQHPRIIRVYDYGVDAGVPFYTMELLDGHDLEKVVPVPWRRACGYLRDVATSLLLLHQRQLLHRDLSPRNVRLTSDGHCKLLDFGTLSSFGIPTEVAGTPALMPPEVARKLSLDQRADLFSLGGLAYYVLTGRMAYPAKRFADLENAWSVAPSPPSLNLRDGPDPNEPNDPIPGALDELVLSLLDVDPLARPASAAEAIDRLTSIAGLAEDGEALSAELYLSSEIVGRESALAELQDIVDRDDHASGGLLIEGASGAGVSRLLKELALRAQVSGKTVLAVDGSTCHGPYSAVRALLLTAFEVAPHDAKDAVGDDGPVMLRAFPELAQHLPAGLSPAPLQGNPGVFRAQIQSAVTEWWRRLAAIRPLALVVDEVQAVDEPSAASLVALSIDGAAGALLVAFGRRTTDAFGADAVLRALHATATRIVLGDLDSDGMRRLVRALLGDVRHVGRFTDWLHGLTGGNPGRTIELVRRLVESEVVQHREGVWILPQELGSVQLPAGMDRVQSERLEQLGQTSLRLAEILSLHEGPVSLELCAALIGSEGHADVLRALDELVRSSVFRVTGSTYYFAQEHFRSLVRARLSPDVQRESHLRIAQCLLRARTVDMQARMAAGFHLVHAGDERQGAELLREAALDLVNRYDDMIAAAPALEVALRIHRAENRPPHQLLELLFPLCFAGYYVDRRLADRHGRATVLLAEELTGLRLARRLRRFLGKALSTWIGLAFGGLRYVITNGPGGVLGFQRLMSTLITCIVFLCAKSTICLEADEAEWLAGRLEPLTALGKRHAATLSHRYAAGLVGVTRGHAARVVREFTAVLEQLKRPEDITDFPIEAHFALTGGALYALGAMQSFLDTSEALHAADRLEQLGHRIYDLAADQIRTNYYACRGDLENAAIYRRKLEAHALTNGSMWQAEVWAPSSQILADIATDDVIGTKRTWSALSRLSKEVPSLERYSIGARLVYLIQTGRSGEALAGMGPMFEGAPPNGFIGWSTSRGSLACVYNLLGRHEEARAVCVETIALLEPDDLHYVALNLRVELQLSRAEAGLGSFDAANARLDALARRHAPNEGKVTMGQIHMAHADIALLSGDMAAFERHASVVDALYHPTKNPALIGQASRLRLRARLAELHAVGAPLTSEPTRGPMAAWARALEACHDVGDRAQLALGLIVAQTAARGGFLFHDASGQPQLVASSREESPNTDIVDGVRNEFARRLEARTELAERPMTAASETTLVMAVSTDAAAGPSIAFHPLFRGDPGSQQLVAVIALERDQNPLFSLDGELMRLVARHL